LTEEGVRAHVAPLFSRVRAASPHRIYLANHSLGRPLDATADDVHEALTAWYTHMGEAWTAWGVEISAYRARLAMLLGAIRPDCVVPKTSAGQGLRAVLNTYDTPPNVVATRGEFDSLDLILREYAKRRRIALTMIEPREGGSFDGGDVLSAIGASTDLVVVSQVMFQTGQVLPRLPAIVARAHEVGARILLDVYHSLGVFAVDLNALDVDFAVGGQLQVFCAVAPARAFFTFIRVISTAVCDRSTSAGSPRNRRSTISARIHRVTDPAAMRGSNRHLQCCRFIRPARGRCSRCPSESIDCAIIHWRCSVGWSQCFANTACVRKAEPKIAVPSSSSRLRGASPPRKVASNRSPHMTSLPTRAANG
jgi:hypothetical protein